MMDAVIFAVTFSMGALFGILVCGVPVYIRLKIAERRLDQAQTRYPHRG